jgi:hypothetical protein
MDNLQILYFRGTDSTYYYRALSAQQVNQVDPSAATPPQRDPWHEETAANRLGCALQGGDIQLLHLQ